MERKLPMQSVSNSGVQRKTQGHIYIRLKKIFQIELLQNLIKTEYAKTSTTGY